MTRKVNEKAPPGWSGTVNKMIKDHPEIENPYAIAWGLYKKGAKPHYKPMKDDKTTAKGEPKKYKKYQDESNESDMSYDHVNDAAAVTGVAGLKKGQTQIWYLDRKKVKKDIETYYALSMDDGSDLAKKGLLPKPGERNISATHILLGEITETDLNRIFHIMQGEVWSPAGQANNLIKGKGLIHTSMSVGDIIQVRNKWYRVDPKGFFELKNSYEEGVTSMNGNIAKNKPVAQPIELKKMIQTLLTGNAVHPAEMAALAKKNPASMDAVIRAINAYDPAKRADLIKNATGQDSEIIVDKHIAFWSAVKKAVMDSVYGAKNPKVEGLDESNMSKVTKKEFSSLHKANKLGLVVGGVKKTANEVLKVLKDVGDVSKLQYKPTSRVDVGSSEGDGLTIAIFKVEINGRTFYIVEDRLDNSLNKSVSWDTLEYYSNVYILKESLDQTDEAISEKEIANRMADKGYRIILVPASKKDKRNLFAKTPKEATDIMREFPELKLKIMPIERYISDIENDEPASINRRNPEYFGTTVRESSDNEVYEAKKRIVRVEYSDGSTNTISMAAGLPDKDIHDYFQVGRTVNIGNGPYDKMVKIKKVTILEAAPLEACECCGRHVDEAETDMEKTASKVMSVATPAQKKVLNDFQSGTEWDFLNQMGRQKEITPKTIDFILEIMFNNVEGDMSQLEKEHQKYGKKMGW